MIRRNCHDSKFFIISQHYLQLNAESINTLLGISSPMISKTLKIATQ